MKEQQRFKHGDVAVVSGSRTYGSTLQGAEVVITDPFVDRSSSAGRVIIEVAPKDRALVGDKVRIYQDECTALPVDDFSSFTVPRDMLMSWKTALENSDYGDSDSDGIIEAMDSMLNPVVTQEYTITLTGRKNLIEDVMGDVGVSDHVLSDKVTYVMAKTSEKMVDGNGK